MPRKAGYRKMYRKGETRYTLQKKKVEKPKPKYFFKEKASSYLKYLRVVRKYIQKKYELNLSELELILFLYDEQIFNEETFDGYAKTLGFTSFNWFEKFRDRGIIKKWIDQQGYKSLYVLTQRYKIAMNKFYSHLEGEAIPEKVAQNPLFSSTASFSDKMYSRLIKQMNKKRSEQDNKDPDHS